MNKKTGRLKASSAEIYYELSGNMEGKPLLALHGGLGSSHDLACVLDYIPADYLVVAIDFRGHGQSTLGTEPLSYARHQKDVEAVLNHLQISQYSIFGFSDGGIVGYRIASENPNKVERLITLGSSWRLEPDDPSIEAYKRVTSEFWSQRFPEDVARYNSLNPSPNFSQLVEAVKGIWLDNTETGYPNKLVERIECPILVMRGENDFLFSLHEAVQLAQQLTDCHFANIPFTAHASHKEYPELVNLILNKFLSANENE